MEYSKDVEVLPPSELLKGDVSMEIVSKRMGRTYTPSSRSARSAS